MGVTELSMGVLSIGSLLLTYSPSPFSMVMVGDVMTLRSMNGMDLWEIYILMSIFSRLFSLDIYPWFSTCFTINDIEMMASLEFCSVLLLLER